jgi:hypothetical protein
MAACDKAVEICTTAASSCLDGLPGPLADAAIQLLQLGALGDPVKKARHHAVKSLSLLLHLDLPAQNRQTITTIMAAKSMDPHLPTCLAAIDSLCPQLQIAHTQVQLSGNPKQLERHAAVLARLLRVVGVPSSHPAVPASTRQAVAESVLTFLSPAPVQAAAISIKKRPAAAVTDSRPSSRVLCGYEGQLSHQTCRLAALLQEFAEEELWKATVLLEPILQQLPQ